MKPLVLYRVSVAVLLLIIISQASLAQSCEEPRTPSIVAYLQYKGAGWEMGWWPGGSPLGIFVGMSVSKQYLETSGKDGSAEFIGTQVYGKIQLRLYERVALTTTAGMVNAQEFYYSAGLRFNFPLNINTAIIGEPQVGNRGFNLQLGIAKRF